MPLLGNRSVGYTTKGSVHVRVVGLKPVAEGTTKKASSGARGTAFHDIMPHVEEIGRISGIEGKRLEPGERFKKARSPLPTVANEILNTKSAATSRKSV